MGLSLGFSGIPHPSYPPKGPLFHEAWKPGCPMRLKGQLGKQTGVKIAVRSAK
jgi:hypothetical protein